MLIYDHFFIYFNLLERNLTLHFVPEEFLKKELCVSFIHAQVWILQSI